MLHLDFLVCMKFVGSKAKRDIACYAGSPGILLIGLETLVTW